MVLALVQTPAPGVEGTWRGTLATGAGSLRLVLNISRAADGLLSASLDSLDQGSTNTDRRHHGERRHSADLESKPSARRLPAR
jgi:hypothetical protein